MTEEAALDKAFKDLIDNLPGGAFTYSAEPDEQFDYISQPMLDMLGYTEEEFREKFDNRFSQMVYEEDRERTLAEIEEQVRETQTDTVEYRIERKDGSLLWVFDAGRCVGDPGHRRFYVVLADETRQRAMAKEVADLNRHNRILSESMDVVLFDYEVGSDTITFDIYRRDKQPVHDVYTHYAEHLRKDSNMPDKVTDKILETIKTASLMPESGSFDCEHHLFGAESCWGRVHYVSMLDSRGDVSDIVGRIDDIAKEKESEQRYLEEQSYLESLSGGYLTLMRVNLSRDVVESVSGNDVIFPVALGAETGYTDVFGEVAARLDHRSLAVFQESVSREALLNAFEEGRTTVSCDYIITRGDGRPLWTRLTARLFRRLPSEDIIALVYTEDIEAEKTTQAVRERYLVKHFDFIFSINGAFDSYRAVLVSEECAPEFKGYQPSYSKAMEAYIRDRVSTEDIEGLIEFTRFENIDEGIRSGTDYVYMFSMKDMDGALRYKRLEFIDLDRENKNVAMVRTDITDMHNAQIEQANTLRTALAAAQQASVAKSEFLSHMSHEIRTPMNAIIGLTTILLKRNDLDPEIENALSKIGLSSRYLLSLINDILDMSRIESGQMVLAKTEFNFEKFIAGINTIIYPQCQSAGLDYECIVRGFTEETYIGDETKLQQVIVNLLGNAVKFTPSGGKVHLMAEQVSHDNNTARLRFTVSDTGVGISEEFLPHLFDSFSQEETGRTSVYGGSGLGLAISSHIVSLMDGTINVHSIKNVGSEFTVEVTVGSSMRARNRAALRTAFNLESLKTLIIDDDVIVCEHTRVVLEEVGIKAQWVDSGARGVELVTKMHAEANDFDLILLDWKMPDMDGIETARRIREVVGPEITIIIMTAYDWENIEKQAHEAGVDTFITKPLFASSVIDVFEEIYSRKAAAKPVIERGPDYDFTGKRVLLVEDNVINIEVAKILLEEKGFVVDVAENGIEAIEGFTTTAPGYYDAILMDIRMPIMDGLTAASQIRRFKKSDAKTIPIIAMTADAFDTDIDRSLESGMNAHLSKPIEPDLLYEMLARYVGQADQPLAPEGK